MRTTIQKIARELGEPQAVGSSRLKSAAVFDRRAGLSGGFDPSLAPMQELGSNDSFNPVTGSTTLGSDPGHFARPGGNRGIFMRGTDRGVRMWQNPNAAINPGVGRTTHPLYAQSAFAPGVHTAGSGTRQQSYVEKMRSDQIDELPSAQRAREQLATGGHQRGSDGYNQAMSEAFQGMGRVYNPGTGNVEDVQNLTARQVMGRHDSSAADLSESEVAGDRQQMLRQQGSRRSFAANARRYGLITDQQLQQLAAENPQGLRLSVDRSSDGRVRGIRGINYISDEAYAALSQMAAENQNKENVVARTDLAPRGQGFINQRGA